uniref:Uncharacterized protein n=1 Tax=Bracon brevicornis TaxID=1563983 RepID=A0A6V7JJ50_9HYME
MVESMKPKLRIKISRDDNLAELGVIDITKNVTTLYRTTSGPTKFIYQAATLSPSYLNEWQQSFIRDLRGN